MKTPLRVKTFLVGLEKITVQYLKKQTASKESGMLETRSNLNLSFTRQVIGTVLICTLNGNGIAECSSVCARHITEACAERVGNCHMSMEWGVKWRDIIG